jgi:hypothetical protein
MSKKIQAPNPITEQAKTDIGNVFDLFGRMLVGEDDPRDTLKDHFEKHGHETSPALLADLKKAEERMLRRLQKGATFKAASPETVPDNVTCVACRVAKRVCGPTALCQEHQK